MLTSSMRKSKDYGLEHLLYLDGDRYFIDEKGEYQVYFKVKTTKSSTGMPHSVSYSLVLIDRSGSRIVGFDNAHAVPSGGGRSRKKTVPFDHKHIKDKTRPYNFQGADKLLVDFWKEVDKILKEDL
jgi:hypothetical protein